jgi:nucleotide-binding universal stress UspA family protein
MIITKKILVGLDGSKMDPTLVSFINYILLSSPVEHIYFLNVISKVKHLADDGFQAKKIDEAALLNRKNNLQKILESGITNESDAQIHLDVIKGTPYKEFLNFIKKEDIDVVITGRKKELTGGGELNKRLARRATCNLILIPEGHVPNLRKLLVPVDVAHFNIDASADYSTQAINYANYISRSNDNEIEIVCQNIYSVPTGFHYTGKSFEEYGNIMRQNCVDAFEKWIKEIDTEGVPITPVYTLKRDLSFGEIIRQTSSEHDVSGIIIGAKGRSASSSIFMSSSAEDLIRNIDYLPLTIVRPKGVSVGVLSSLREL